MWSHWLSGVRSGDWGVWLLSALGVGTAFVYLWQGSGNGEWAVIRQRGQIVAELSLQTPRRLEVAGPLGSTLIEIQSGRARIAADPGPRQYCVKQGWLSRNGEIAICAPNQVSLQIRGQQTAYDTLAY